MTVDTQPREAASASDLERLTETMYRIRCFEEELLRLYRSEALTGTTHTSVGQEAIAAGVLAHLRSGDAVVSNHRCHGHYLAAGGDAAALYAEIRGSADGVCRGIGGSQHLHFGRFYSNGILGGTLPLAAGLAMADAIRKTGAVTVCFVGDGALGEGTVYETLNLSALWRLPVLFVIEDNGYAQSTPQHLQLAGTIRARFAAFAIEVDEVDGNDVEAVFAVAGRAFAAIRAELRPRCVIASTYRLEAHSKGDDVRDPAEIAAARLREPLRRIEQRLGLHAAALRQAAEAATAVVSRSATAPALAFIAPDRPGVAVSAPAWNAGGAGTYLSALQATLRDLMDADERVHLLGEDLIDPYGGAFKVTAGLSTRHPDRVWTTPISEAAIVGVANGLALSGLRPVVELMFGDFTTLAVDQLVNHATKFARMYGDRVRCPVVVRAPMGGRRGYGPTHSQSLEKLFLGVPGLTVVAADPIHDPREIWRRIVALDAPCLFVENKVLYGTKLAAIANGRCGAFRVTAFPGAFPTTRLRLAEPADAAIVAYGGMVLTAMAAAQRLFEEEELVVDVVVPAALAPLDLDALRAALDGAYPVVVTEEGTERAGFGAELIAALVTAGGPRRRFVRVATPDTIVPNSAALERELLPDEGRLAAALRSACVRS